MSKLYIQNEQGETIVGIFEKKEAIDAHRFRPRLILFTHGVLGHKDYLYQRLLAEKLPYSTFRFDFRGNGESTGEPGYANMAEDVEDIYTVANYFENQLGYEIYAIIGHSRGSTAGFKYATSCEKPLSFYINVAGRFNMQDLRLDTSRPELSAALKSKGYFDWKVRQRDRIVTIKVTEKEVEKYRSWSTEHIEKMPLATSVLTCHGLEDNICHPYNAAMYANRIPDHSLVLFSNCDHNFKGHFEKLVKTIVEFFAKHEQDQYQKAMGMGQNTGLVLPRWIDIQGVKNFRDIGGYIIQNGTGYIRERMVFRSGNLAKITDEGIQQLKYLSVKAIFDFRQSMEIDADKAMKDTEGISRFNLNLYENVIKSPEEYFKKLMLYLQGEEGFAESYMGILSSGKTHFAKIFRYMIKELSLKDRGSMIVHCSAGKDRTGVFIMLLLGLCGVDDEVILREYEMTKLGYFEFEKELKPRAKAMGISEDDLRAAMSVSYNGMKIAIRRLKETYGSYEGYVRDGCGLSSQEIAAVREIMVVPIRFEERQLFRSKI
ncbi:protein-tyrosine phosphatase-like protein [Sporodiniella umbellata]|nr:protein-tyrosine phosphatase-like protein [Sporodiniella umbellata]